MTPRQESFVQLVASGKTASDAYRASYNCQRFKPETVWEEASRLMSNPNVAARLSELKAKATDKAVENLAITRERILRDLLDNSEMMRQEQIVLDEQGRPTGETIAPSPAHIQASTRALELLGKELAMFVDRKEIRTGPLDGLSKDELAERAAEIAQRIGIKPNAPARRH